MIRLEEDDKKENTVSCTYSQVYHDYQNNTVKTFKCEQEPLENRDLCLFHDEDFLKDINHPENEEIVIQRLYRKIQESISNDAPLYCIGYYLPDVKIEGKFKRPVHFDNCKFRGKADFSNTKFSSTALFINAKFLSKVYFYRTKFVAEALFSNIEFSEIHFSYTEFLSLAYFSNTMILSEAHFSDSKFFSETYFPNTKFSSKTYFSNAKFLEEADFSNAKFSSIISFSNAKFSSEADFSSVEFSAKADFKETTFSDKDTTCFNSVIFEKANDIRFDVKDMSRVSFLDTDITGVRFSDKTTWGGKDKFEVIEERWFKKQIKEYDKREKVVSLGGILSVYRNLRENYEFRRRYDEAGEFFIKEMELKRNHKLWHPHCDLEFPFKQKNWFERHVSFTGLYYHLSKYGESLQRPAVIGFAIVVLYAFFLVTQIDPHLIPTLPIPFLDYKDNSATKYTIQPTVTSVVTNKALFIVNSTAPTYSTFIGIGKALDPIQWIKAFERSIMDFIPLLPLGSGIKMSLTDYVIKIVGSVIFGVIVIALRRKFERKYYH